MDTDELRKLLDEATPGPWVADQEIKKYWRVVQSGNWLNDVADRVPRGPDARLIALAPTLARTVIAAEKLVQALRLYSCENECDECADVDRDRVGCGWVARQALDAWEAAQ